MTREQIVSENNKRRVSFNGFKSLRQSKVMGILDKNRVPASMRLKMMNKYGLHKNDFSFFQRHEIENLI